MRVHAFGNSLLNLDLMPVIPVQSLLDDLQLLGCNALADADMGNLRPVGGVLEVFKKLAKGEKVFFLAKINELVTYHNNRRNSLWHSISNNHKQAPF